MKLDIILPKGKGAVGFKVYINDELRKDIHAIETQEPEFQAMKLFEGCGAEWIEDENTLHFRATHVPDKMIEVKNGVLMVTRTIDDYEEFALSTDLLF